MEDRERKLQKQNSNDGCTFLGGKGLYTIRKKKGIPVWLWLIHVDSDFGGFWRRANSFLICLLLYFCCAASRAFWSWSFPRAASVFRTHDHKDKDLERNKKIPTFSPSLLCWPIEVEALVLFFFRFESDTFFLILVCFNLTKVFFKFSPLPALPPSSSLSLLPLTHQLSLGGIVALSPTTASAWPRLAGVWQEKTGQEKAKWKGWKMETKKRKENRLKSNNEEATRSLGAVQFIKWQNLVKSSVQPLIFEFSFPSLTWERNIIWIGNDDEIEPSTHRRNFSIRSTCVMTIRRQQYRCSCSWSIASLLGINRDSGSRLTTYRLRFIVVIVFFLFFFSYLLSSLGDLVGNRAESQLSK